MKETFRDLWESHLDTVLEPLVRTGSDRSANLSALSKARDIGLAALEESRRATQRICTTLNSLVPVCRLPCEVLAHVFLTLRTVYPASNGYKKHERLGYVQILHVCRVWRQVALQTGNLWTRIDLELGPTWATHFLEWSRSYPIAIDTWPHTTIGCSRVIDVISQVLRLASPRIEVLDFTQGSVTRNNMHAILKLLSTATLPRLEELALSSNGYLYSPLPIQIFRNVRHMAISEVMVGLNTPWSLLPRTLQSLELGIPDTREWWPLQPQHLNGLFLHIGHCAELTSLSITSSFLKALPLDDTIVLPSVQSLSLIGQSSPVLNFLQHIVFVKPMRTLRLNLICAKVEELAAITARISQDGKRLTSASYKKLTLIGSPGSFEVMASIEDGVRHLGIEKYTRTYASLTVSIRVDSGALRRQDGDFPQRDNIILATNILSSIDISSLKTVHVSDLLLPPSLWHRLFHSARRVRYLELERSNSLSCLRALGLLISQASPPTADNMLFPALASLSIQRACLETVVAPALEPGHAAAVLGLTLVERVKLACSPRELHLGWCKVDPHELQRWVDLVPPELREWTVDSLRKNVRTPL